MATRRHQLKFDALMAKSREVADSTERNKLYAEAEAGILAEDMPPANVYQYGLPVWSNLMSAAIQTTC